ncbi:MAG: asparagine synthase C-terminal domain-containing protein [Ignavibacteriales bacterium]|nr:asparagine synthase C-terminal domain-containing protein [Ignavibacteriales bacterium]
METIKELLFDAVKLRLRSDVPLGYALSGIDSSSIVGIASKINHGSDNTFSMIYPGDSVDESFYINKVVEKTGVNHYFVTPTAEDLIKDLDNFIWHQEEPFLGTSYFGEFKLRELIRKEGVTVSLEGQGADEITQLHKFSIPYFFDLLSNFRFHKFIKEYKLFNNSVNNPLKIINAYFKRKKKQNISYLSKKYPYLNIEYFPNATNSYDFKEAFDSGSHLNDKLYEMLLYTLHPAATSKGR